MSVPKFASVDKPIRDLLFSSYTFDRQLKVVSTAPNGVVFQSEVTMDRSSAVSALLSSRFNVTPNLFVDKLELSTSNRVSAEASLRHLVKNTTFFLKAQMSADSAKGKDFGKLGFERSGALVNVDGEVDVVNATVRAGAVLRHRGFLVGATATVDTHYDGSGNAEISEYDGVVGYETSDFGVALRSADKGNKLTLSLLQSYSARAAIGASAEYRRTGKDLADRTLISVGGQYQLDVASSLRGRVDSQGIVTAAYTQQLRPGVKLVTSASVDAKQLEGDHHKMGFSVTFGF